MMNFEDFLRDGSVFVNGQHEIIETGKISQVVTSKKVTTEDNITVNLRKNIRYGATLVINQNYIDNSDDKKHYYEIILRALPKRKAGKIGSLENYKEINATFQVKEKAKKAITDRHGNLTISDRANNSSLSSTKNLTSIDNNRTLKSIDFNKLAALTLVHNNGTVSYPLNEIKQENEKEKEKRILNYCEKLPYKGLNILVPYTFYDASGNKYNIKPIRLSKNEYSMNLSINDLSLGSLGIYTMKQVKGLINVSFNSVVSNLYDNNIKYPSAQVLLAKIKTNLSYGIDQAFKILNNEFINVYGYTDLLPNHLSYIKLERNQYAIYTSDKKSSNYNLFIYTVNHFSDEVTFKPNQDCFSDCLKFIDSGMLPLSKTYLKNFMFVMQKKLTGYSDMAKKLFLSEYTTYDQSSDGKTIRSTRQVNKHSVAVNKDTYKVGITKKRIKDQRKFFTNLLAKGELVTYQGYTFSIIPDSKREAIVSIVFDYVDQNGDPYILLDRSHHVMSKMQELQKTLEKLNVTFYYSN